MSQTPKLPQREPSLILQAAIQGIWDQMDSSGYQGHPLDDLDRVEGLQENLQDLREESEVRKMLSPGSSFQSSTSNRTTEYWSFTSNQASQYQSFSSFSKSGATLAERITDEEPAIATNHSKILVLSQNESLAVKLDELLSEVGDESETEEEPKPEKKGRWVIRRLQPAVRTTDPQPKRLGPTGTWINEDGRERRQTQTSATIRRHDTLTD